jgi:GxxExxY protein
MTENAIAKEIVDAAYRIHTTLGPGLLESVYHAVLAYELAQRGLRTVSQQPIPVVYGTIRIDIGFRADLIVEDQVIIDNQIGRGSRAGSQKATSYLTDCKESLSPRRKDAKNPSEATGFPRLVGLRSKTSLAPAGFPAMARGPGGGYGSMRSPDLPDWHRLELKECRLLFDPTY